MSLNKSLITITRQLGATYTLNGRAISLEEIFSDTGLLPAISRRADQLCSLCLGYGIGVSFEEADGTLLGVKVIYDEVTPDILRYMCILDIMCELIHTAPSKDAVSLDELMYD